jgi:hypothetical protein
MSNNYAFCCCIPYLYNPFLKGWSCGVTININTDWTEIHLSGIYADTDCNVNCPDYVIATAPSCNDVTIDNFWNADQCLGDCVSHTGAFQNLDENIGHGDTWLYGICATPASSEGSHGLYNLEYCDEQWGSPEACAGCEVATCDSLICNDGDLEPPLQSNPEASCVCTDSVVVNQQNIHNYKCLERNCGGEFGVCNCDEYTEGPNPIGKLSQHGLIVDKWGGDESEYANALPAAYRTNNPVVQDALVIEPHDNQPIGCVLDCRLILHFQEVIFINDQFPIPNTNPVQNYVPDIILYPGIYAFFDMAPLCRFGNGIGSAECMYVPDRTLAPVCNFDGWKSVPPLCGTGGILTTEAPSYWAELKIQITVPAQGPNPAAVYDFAWRGYGTPVHIHDWIAYYCVDTLGNPLIKDQRATATPPSEHWMGLRVPESCLNKITGKYTKEITDGADANGLAVVGPKYLCDSIQVNSYIKPCTISDRIQIPDNSDFFRATETSDTRFAWSGQFRYGYGFRMCLTNMNRIGSSAAFGAAPGANNCTGPSPCIGAGGSNPFGPSNDCGGGINYTGECAFAKGNCPNTIVTNPASGDPVCCGCSPLPCENVETYEYSRSSFIGECQAGFILDPPLYWSRYNQDIDDGIYRLWVGNPEAYPGSGCASSAGCPFSYCKTSGANHCAVLCTNANQQGGQIPTWSIES